jgi:hypothetical protein
MPHRSAVLVQALRPLIGLLRSDAFKTRLRNRTLLRTTPRNEPTLVCDPLRAQILRAQLLKLACTQASSSMILTHKHALVQGLRNTIIVSPRR